MCEDIARACAIARACQSSNGLLQLLGPASELLFGLIVLKITQNSLHIRGSANADPPTNLYVKNIIVKNYNYFWQVI